MRICLRRVGRAHCRSIRARDGYVLVPLLSMNWSAVYLETNVVVLDLDKRNMRRVARLYRWAPQREGLLQLPAAGRNRPILQLQTLRTHGESRTLVHHLRFQIATD